MDHPTLGDRMLSRVVDELATGAAASPFLGSLGLAERVELLPPGSPAAALGAALIGADATVPTPGSGADATVPTPGSGDCAATVSVAAVSEPSVSEPAVPEPSVSDRKAVFHG